MVRRVNSYKNNWVPLYLFFNDNNYYSRTTTVQVN